MLTEEQLRLTNELKTARGKRFGAILKQTYQAIAPELIKEARVIKTLGGKLSIMQIAMLAVKFNLQLKHCFDFLEDVSDQVLPSGTYDKLLSRGLKPNKVMEEARQMV